MGKKWIFKIFNAAAITLILASLFVLISVVLTPAGEVPQVLGYSVFRVMTGSMEPDIPENSFLLVKKTPPEGIQPGDVISFVSPDPMLEGAVNTHRVVRVETYGGKRQFVTKGDANLIEDSYRVEESMLVGRMVFCSYLLGMAVTLLSSPLVFGSLIVLPLLVILVMNLFRAVRIASDIAKKEEEAAVRQALEEIKARQNAQHGQD